jgi:multifunctional 2-oxoglutarate metabolism enzyme
VTGFEYGYSVSAPDALVIWEAQFGDFANGAQIIFDQFLSAAQAKWGQTSTLVLLLPHGYEGQGPEHSSARLERFLQLCAEGNMSVCNLSSPASLFHGLRRQIHGEVKRPLVIMSPKSLLRHPLAVSDPDEFTSGSFREILGADVEAASGVERVVFCSGKIYYDLLMAARENPEEGNRVALVRCEQLYPFASDAVRAEIARFPESAKVLWAQEESANMGAWSFVRPRFDEILAALRDAGSRIEYVGRPASASPATGSANVHQREQERIVREALGLG